MITRYIHENISYITCRYYTCEGCYYIGARYVPRTWSRERRSSRSFSVLRSYERMHLGENVPRNAPRARNEDDRRETDVIKDDARGGKEDRQMRLPGCRRGSCTPLCTQPVYRPSRVMRCDCAQPMTVSSERDTISIVSVPISNSMISTCCKYWPTEKHDCDRYFVTRSSERDARFFHVPAATS